MVNQVTDPDLLRRLRQEPDVNVGAPPSARSQLLVTDPDLTAQLMQEPDVMPTVPSANSPVDLWQRSLLSIKLTPEGKVGYLESIFGEGKARVVDGETQVLMPPQEQLGIPARWVPTDEAGATLGDLADAAGVLIEAAPEVAVGFRTASPLAAGVAGAAGNLLRQGLSAMIPGDEGLGLRERAQMFGIRALESGLSQKIFNVVSPERLFSRQARRADDFTRAGREMSARSGIDLSVAQTSGDTTAELVEASLANSMYVGDEFTKLAQAQSEQAISRIRHLQRMSTQAYKGATETGERVIETIDKALSDLVLARRAQANIDFGKIDQLTQGKIFSLDNFKAAAQEWIDELGVAGSAPQQRAIAKQLESTLKQLGDEPVTAKHMLRLLNNWSQKSLFKTEARAIDSAVGAKLMRALDADMGVAASTGSDDVVRAIKTARGNWHKGSEALRQTKKMTLMKLDLEIADPDVVLDKLIKLPKATLKRHLEILKRADPDIMGEIRAAFLERALKEGFSGKPAKEGMVNPMDVFEGAFSRAKFASYTHANADFVRTAFSGKELADVSAVIGALQRTTMNEFMKGSRTGPFAAAWDHLKNVLTINPINLTKGVGEAAMLALNHRQLAKIMTTQGGRNALRAMTSQQKLPRAQALQIMQYLAFLSGAEKVRTRETVGPTQSPPAAAFQGQ